MSRIVGDSIAYTIPVTVGFVIGHCNTRVPVSAFLGAIAGCVTFMCVND